MLPTSYDNALSVDLQLAVGTLKLEGTANAVDPATAANLLPLWKAVNSLTGADTTSPIEINALYKQIKDAMTLEQVAAITAMKLTRADMVQVAQEKGLTIPGMQAASTGSQTSSSSLSAKQPGYAPGCSHDERRRRFGWRPACRRRAWHGPTFWRWGFKQQLFLQIFQQQLDILFLRVVKQHDEQLVERQQEPHFNQQRFLHRGHPAPGEPGKISAGKIDFSKPGGAGRFTRFFVMANRVLLIRV